MSKKKQVVIGCPSWLHGKLSEDIEINTKIPYVAIYDYFSQGEEAEDTISEINKIYCSDGRLSPLGAAKKWASFNL